MAGQNKTRKQWVLLYFAGVNQDKRLSIKVVGRRGKAKVDVESFDSMQKAANILRQGRPFVPKGIWRFKSFEEADEWMLKMLTRPGNRGSQP